MMDYGALLELVLNITRNKPMKRLKKANKTPYKNNIKQPHRRQLQARSGFLHWQPRSADIAKFFLLYP